MNPIVPETIYKDDILKTLLGWPVSLNKNETILDAFCRVRRENDIISEVESISISTKPEHTTKVNLFNSQDYEPLDKSSLFIYAKEEYKVSPISFKQPSQCIHLFQSNDSQSIYTDLSINYSEEFTSFLSDKFKDNSKKNSLYNDSAYISQSNKDHKRMQQYEKYIERKTKQRAEKKKLKENPESKEEEDLEENKVSDDVEVLGVNKTHSNSKGNYGKKGFNGKKNHYKGGNYKNSGYDRNDNEGKKVCVNSLFSDNYQYQQGGSYYNNQNKKGYNPNYNTYQDGGYTNSTGNPISSGYSYNSYSQNPRNGYNGAYSNKDSTVKSMNDNHQDHQVHSTKKSKYSGGGKYKGGGYRNYK